LTSEDSNVLLLQASHEGCLNRPSIDEMEFMVFRFRSIELLIPYSFKIECIDQHKPCHIVYCSMR
uniref:Uncharacterized protein n=1 Tax=Solanum lycopersicum TaxID=4081 RepID=A0A3Q7GAH4_SOLLC